MLRPYFTTIANYRIHHLLHRIPFHVSATLQACLRPGTGPQQPQEIIDFGGGPDGRTARGRGVLLFDRDGRRKALHRIDERLRHSLEELLGIRRQRFDIAALSLGVERVERERAFPRARWARNDGERPARKLDGDALQIMLAYVAENDALGGMAHNPQK